MFGFVVTFLISKRANVKVQSTLRSEGLYQEGSVCCLLYSIHFMYSTREDGERAVMWLTLQDAPPRYECKIHINHGVLESQCNRIQLLLLADFCSATEQNIRVNLCLTTIFATAATASAASRPLQLACPRNLEPRAYLVGVLATQITPNAYHRILPVATLNTAVNPIWEIPWMSKSCTELAGILNFVTVLWKNNQTIHYQEGK